MNNNYLAIDIGGTSIKVAIVNKKGNLISKKSYLTPQDTYEGLLVSVRKIIAHYKNEYKISGIGFAIPAVTDSMNGIIKSKGSLIYIKNKHFVQDLKETEGLPIIIENDANCAALAEVWLGSAKDNKNIVFLVIGTGIGGAVINNRKVVSGANLFTGEFGYGIHNFDYENLTGNIWSLTSATQILVNKAAKNLGIDANQLNGKKVFQLAKENDSLRKLIDEFYFNLAIGIHNIQYYIDPEKIIVGGGISQRANLIKEINYRLRIIYKRLGIDEIFPNLDTCTFHNDANLLGAVYNYIR
ncbi:MAG TPA: ROK family protein [Clostridia bacterium]|nr:ROK family protein [Clostridia bacterium]